MSKQLTRTMVSLLVVAPVALWTFIPSSGGAETEACRALADLRIEDTNLLSATVVPAGDGLPEYCRVLGYVRPAINFEIRLPTSNWNGKFYMAGCGGFCGKIEADQPGFFNSATYGLKRNYAISKMDAGHWGDWRDGKWAYHNRQAEIDWGYRAVHETARVTKAIIEAFYGSGPERSYFQGCSTGGRMAHMEAWRYPDDFDGIISGAPAVDYLGLVGLYYTWLAKFNTGPDGKNIITLVEAKLVEEAVYDACDHLDGLEDGLISDPRACTFDPEVLACKGKNGTECLSPEQVEVLKAFYGGPRNAAGDLVYPEGVPFGSEPYWGLWITGETANVRDDLLSPLTKDFLRYLAFPEDPGEQYSILDFDFDRDPLRLAYMAQFFNSDDPDLDAFREGGGKLLMWHGWGDAAVPPLGSIDYYEAVEKHVGSRETTQDFLRLFMVPGMDHCGIGEGPGITDSGFDPLTALEQWVEQGEAPASLLTTKTDLTGMVLWARPVCPYPERAMYKGRGDVKDASNFECVAP